MNKRKSQYYTTLQVSKELNKHIKKICLENGWIASAMTEYLWIGLISSSMSGSFLREI